MGTNFNYRAFSMEYGTFVGLCWSVLFLSYTYGVREANAFYLIICFLFCVLSVLVPFVLALRMRRKVNRCGQNMSYWQGLLFSFSMFMYACLLNGLVVYGYFELLDNGELVSALSKLIGAADIKNMYAQMGMAEQYSEVMKMLDEVNELSSFEKALLMFNNNFTWGLLMSFLVAIAASLKKSKK